MEIMTGCVVGIVLGVISLVIIHCTHLIEKQRAEHFKALCNDRHVYIGTPEQLARLREWGEQNNR